MNRDEMVYISVDEIESPAVSMRSYLEEGKFEKLMKSIKQMGVLQPIRVYKAGKKYKIVFGERRFLAAKAAGLVEVPALVVKKDDKENRNAMLAENLIREDIDPVDLGMWLKDFKDESGLTFEAVGAQFGYGRGWAENLIGLTRCDEDLQEAVRAGHIDTLSARRLMTVKDPVVRRDLLGHAVESGATQRVIGGWVAQAQVAQGDRPAAPPVSGGGGVDTSPEPLYCNCAWCKDEVGLESAVTVRMCGRCYVQFQQAVRAESEIKPEPKPKEN